MTILVTGAAGFIGANFVRDWLAARDEAVVSLDCLSYAGHAANLPDDPRHELVIGDIADAVLVGGVLDRHRPRAVMHFAAETHVDRSIAGPEAFVRTNVVGTFSLLEVVRAYWSASPPAEREAFRFVHISTDEVYGSLGFDDAPVTEASAYAPNSPYSASKAASDHFVRAAHRTYGLPVLTTHCSNNYGPYQYPEKLIPVVIRAALGGRPIPVYGEGRNVRDWLNVGDHCAAVRLVLEQGRTGETYNIGGGTEIANIDLVHRLCAILDELAPAPRPYREQVTFVGDRPGHDLRYAIDSGKIARELGWSAQVPFDDGIRATVRWYLDNAAWMDAVLA